MSYIGQDEMSIRHLWLIAALFLGISLLVSCALSPTTSTVVTGTWMADNYNNKLSDFLVISLADEPGMRGKVESIMVNTLDKNGLRAKASSEIMPVDEEINRKTVTAAIAGKGFDGVLVTRLLDVERTIINVPPAPETGFERSFNRAPAPIVFSPDYVKRNSVISLQVDLYDIASKRLVWSLNSDTSNFQNVNDVANSVSKAVVRNLRSKGLI